LPAGIRLGPYEILEPLGAGGMGEVYRAHDTKVDRHVALKVLPEGALSDEEARRRFQREATALSRLWWCSHVGSVGFEDASTALSARAWRRAQLSELLRATGGNAPPENETPGVRTGRVPTPVEPWRWKLRCGNAMSFSRPRVGKRANARGGDEPRRTP
jgi:hypothetical protein